MHHALGTCAAVLLIAAPTAAARPGDLDQTFSSDGLVTTATPSLVQSLAVQPDGAVLAGGSAGYGTPQATPLVTRYLPDGRLDSSFGTAGVVSFDLGAISHARELAAQPDGAILVAGTVGNGGFDGDFAVTRLLPDGRLDPSFGGGDGTQRIDFAGNFDVVLALALAPDGRIVVAGTGTDGTGSKALVARLEPDGDLDPSFSGDGRAAVDFGVSGDAVSEVVVAPGGAVFVTGGGRTTESGLEDAKIARLDSAGDLDPGFGDGGVATIDLGHGDYAGALDLLADGRIAVAAAVCEDSLHGGIVCTQTLLRLEPDGDLDPSFGDQGRAPAAFSGRAAFDPEGRVVAVSSRNNGRLTRQDFVVGRMGPDGSADESFSDDGRVSTDFGFTSDGPQALALAPDGRIVVAGFAGSRGAIARYEVADGPADADADGYTDGPDACPHRFSLRQGGCPKVARRLRITKASDKHLVGTLISIAPGCESSQKIRVLEAGPGRDAVVAKTKTKQNGNWRVDKELEEGRYYARARATIDPKAGLCTAVTSRAAEV